MRPRAGPYYYSQVLFKLSALGICLAAMAAAQPAKKTAAPPVHAESPSTFNYTMAADGEEIVEIRNTSYEVSGTAIPGRPTEQHLLLRKTIRSRQVLSDEGTESAVTLEAWPAGQDPRQKPLYTITASGTDGHPQDNALFIVSRGLAEVEWWSVYKLGAGQHLFDTYVPVISFSITHDVMTTRYAGLYVPPDDTKDARLKAPNVVAVVTYASEERVLHEALLTCDDPKRAPILRSFADATRTLTLVEDVNQLSRTLRLYISDNYPSTPNGTEIRIPVKNDDLDLAHAQLPARLHLAAWKR